VRYFTRKASDGLDWLVAQGHVDSSRVYAAGLSRGGLLAGHLALRNTHVSTVLGFSPVTVLAELAEFKQALSTTVPAAGSSGVPSSSAARLRLLDETSLLSESCVDGLSRCAVRVYSGNADTRVGTRNCFDLMARLAERARADRVRSPPHEYIMYCSLGRDGHGTSSDVFAVGARWLLRRAGLRN
jgi:poly(3-hydroxybutyrate) depolymerase